jgi:hypothetical protein
MFATMAAILATSAFASALANQAFAIHFGNSLQAYSLEQNRHYQTSNLHFQHSSSG